MALPQAVVAPAYLVTEPGPKFDVALSRINLDPGLRRDDQKRLPDQARQLRAQLT